MIVVVIENGSIQDRSGSSGSSFGVVLFCYILVFNLFQLVVFISFVFGQGVRWWG